jgi:hypothetical protein
MYSILKQLESGEFVYVASRDEFEKAVQFAHALNAEWPGEYEVRDSQAALVKLLWSFAQQSNHPIRV